MKEEERKNHTSCLTDKHEKEKRMKKNPIDTNTMLKYHATVLMKGRENYFIRKIFPMHEQTEHSSVARDEERKVMNGKILGVIIGLSGFKTK
ncbi:CLUMA_CG006371, isoform A [Clunio marinus]|uniref:CLUMA_CG006371, isoform A n=1 Tax=Clunio marinus TaxID=568069 RepID=A0A1J1HZA2_9DIPT|nr:CLUMA_CG006371, isoform A [Clunio marinus]